MYRVFLKKESAGSDKKQNNKNKAENKTKTAMSHGAVMNLEQFRAALKNGIEPFRKDTHGTVTLDAYIIPSEDEHLV